jgi:dihydroorotate dehydrogenase
VGAFPLSNPVILSAGFDKSGTSLSGLDQLGFGAITIGSILPSYRPGNPRPRVLRLPDQLSLMNCYGLPSDGLDVVLARLKAHAAGARNTPVIANIDAPDVESYLRSFDAVSPYVDAIELGLQCPNNGDDDGALHKPKNFENLLIEVNKRRTKPVFAKILSYSNEEERGNRLELVRVATQYQIDGVVIPGNWRRPEARLAMGVGTTSGRITFDRALQNVKDIYAITQGKIGIKANGGVFSGEDALEMLLAGASSVDVLTGFVFRGWSVARKICAELIEAMDKRGIGELSSFQRMPAVAA